MSSALKFLLTTFFVVVILVLWGVFLIGVLIETAR